MKYKVTATWRDRPSITKTIEAPCLHDAIRKLMDELIAEGISLTGAKIKAVK